MHRYPVIKKNLVVRLPKSQLPVKQKTIKKSPVVKKLKEVPVVTVPHRLRIHDRKTPSTIKYITKDSVPASHNKLLALRGRYSGRILIIVANGPSINEVDLPRLSSIAKADFMSINKPDDRIWPTEHWLFCDSSQFRRHQGLWSDYNGYIFNSTAIHQQKNTSMQIKNINGKGFSRDLIKGMHIGMSSVFAAMQVALWMGYDKIYIFGVDMCAVNGKLHYYGINPDVDQDRRKNKFGSEAEYYNHAAGILTNEEKSRFYFCSGYNKWPFAEKFNKLHHNDAIDAIINGN